MMTEQEKIRAARAAYAREYRKQHPDRVKAAQEKYWLKRLEQKTPVKETQGESDDEQKNS